MVNLAALLGGLISLAIAAVVGGYGRRQQRRRALVAGTPTTEVRTLDGEGLVELKGEANAGETFRSPIRGDESVLSAWEIEEWDEGGETEMWETRATGVYAEPFTLDDGTGEVRVEVGDHVVGDPSGFQISDVQLGPIDLDQRFSSGVSVANVLCSFERFPVEMSVPPDADPPERIAEFIQGESGVSPQTDSVTNLVDAGTKHDERRYYEGTIEPGQEIYLLGKAETTADATHPLGPDDVVITPPENEDDSLIVSDRTEEALVSELGRYRLAYAATAVLGIIGVGLLLVGGGVVSL